MNMSLLFRQSSRCAVSQSLKYLSLTESSVKSSKLISSQLLFPLRVHGSYQVRYAGHSKWQNIKHTKTAKDAQKSQLFARIAVQIKNSLKGS